MLIILGVILLIGLVIAHEFGHFYAARKAGVEVEEFGIGFPPKAKTITKKNGTVYTLNWLPLGGFVKLKGEHDADTEPGSYGAATLPQKTRIMLAGVVVNLLIAVFLFSVIALSGLPKVFDDQFVVASDNEIVTQEVLVSNVGDNSPATVAGLEQRDDIVALSTDDAYYEINSSDDLRNATSTLEGQEVDITYVRNGEEAVATTTLLSEEVVSASRETDSPKGYLGVVPVEYIEQRATWSAPIVGVVFTAQVIEETFRVFGNIIVELFQFDTTTAEQNVTGVVGIGNILGELSQQGFMSVLLLVALISLSLAIMNFLPIPALDGGRFFVTIMFRMFNKPLTQETEERIHGTGFALLMLLFVLVTIVDVQRIIEN